MRMAGRTGTAGARALAVAIVCVTAAGCQWCPEVHVHDTGGGPVNGGPAGGANASAGTVEIALVPKAMDSEFWLVLADGAKAAAAAHPGTKLSIIAPDREINIDQQVSILEDQTRRGVKALVVSPAGSAQVLSALEQATERGVPVVLVDTDAPRSRSSTASLATSRRTRGPRASSTLSRSIPASSWWPASPATASARSA